MWGYSLPAALLPLTLRVKSIEARRGEKAEPKESAASLPLTLFDLSIPEDNQHYCRGVMQVPLSHFTSYKDEGTRKSL